MGGRQARQTELPHGSRRGTRKGSEQREHCIKRIIASGDIDDAPLLMDGGRGDGDVGFVGTESEANGWRWSACGECGDGASMGNDGWLGNNAAECTKGIKN